jgi:hypothetical protein
VRAASGEIAPRAQSASGREALVAKFFVKYLK